jgi:hypothetical protein
MQKYIYFFVFIFFSLVSKTNAQQDVVCSGRDVTNTDGSSMSYSVGQVFYTITMASDVSIIQGIQQPYEISNFLGYEQVDINLSITAFPNPTTSQLTLTLGDCNSTDLSYQLYDIRGKFIQNKKIADKETRIVMQDLENAVYLLKVVRDNKDIKIFKIIKN